MSLIRLSMVRLLKSWLGLRPLKDPHPRSRLYCLHLSLLIPDYSSRLIAQVIYRAEHKNEVYLLFKSERQTVCGPLLHSLWLTLAFVLMLCTQ